MSESSAQGGHANPSGHGSTGGGGDGGPSKAQVVVGGASGGVTNQPILALDPTVHAHIKPSQHHALRKIQLEFARDTSARAATAYQQVLDVLSRPENGTSTTD